MRHNNHLRIYYKWNNSAKRTKSTGPLYINAWIQAQYIHSDYFIHSM